MQAEAIHVTPVNNRHLKKTGSERKNVNAAECHAPYLDVPENCRIWPAIITDADPGIGRAVSILIEREGAGIAFLDEYPRNLVERKDENEFQEPGT